MPEPVLDFESVLALSLTLAQDDYVTVQPDTELLDVIPLSEASAPEISATQITDRNWTGKGHPYATFQRKVGQDAARRFNMPASLEMIGWSLAHAMGDVTTSGTMPDYTHDFDFADAAVSKQVPVSTIYEMLSAGIEQRYHSMAVRSVEFSIANLQLVSAVAELTGSGEISTGAHAGTPALLSQELLIGGEVDIQIGNPGGALSSIKERIVNATVRVSPNLIENRGRFPGSGQYKGREIFSSHGVSLTVGIEADQANSDFLDYFLADTPKALKIIGTISAARSFTFHWPQFRVGQNQLGYQDRLLQYNVTVGEENIFKETPSASPDVPFEAQVKNGVAGYLG